MLQAMSGDSDPAFHLHQRSPTSCFLMGLPRPGHEEVKTGDG